jgi:transposase
MFNMRMLPMSLYVRDVKIAEGKRIQSILRRSKDRVAIRRAQVIALSDQGMSVQQISRAVYLTEKYIRELIRRFNKCGVELFKPAEWKGRPVEFTEELQAEIVEVAMCPPRLLRQPFNRWGLEKLRDYLLHARIVKKLSVETLRTILHNNNVHLQRTKTWKESNDPDFESKKNG